MELKAIWRKRLEEGKALAKKYPNYGLNIALNEESYRGTIVDGLMEDYANCSEKSAFIREQFFKAGFYGDEPEYVTAVRYGEIPESGRSTNWGTGDMEQGVSVVKILRNGDSGDDGIYSMTCGDRERITINGWFLGRTGSDGEPLLIDAIQI